MTGQTRARLALFYVMRRPCPMRLEGVELVFGQRRIDFGTEFFEHRSD